MLACVFAAAFFEGFFDALEIRFALTAGCFFALFFFVSVTFLRVLFADFVGLLLLFFLAAIAAVYHRQFVPAAL